MVIIDHVVFSLSRIPGNDRVVLYVNNLNLSVHIEVDCELILGIVVRVNCEEVLRSRSPFVHRTNEVITICENRFRFRRINDSSRVVSEVPVEGVLTIDVSLEGHVCLVVLSDASCTREATMITIAIRTPFTIDDELELIIARANVLYGERSIGLVIRKNERNLLCPVVHRALNRNGRIYHRCTSFCIVNGEDDRVTVAYNRYFGLNIGECRAVEQHAGALDSVRTLRHGYFSKGSAREGYIDTCLCAEAVLDVNHARILTLFAEFELISKFRYVRADEVDMIPVTSLRCIFCHIDALSIPVFSTLIVRTEIDILLTSVSSVNNIVFRISGVPDCFFAFHNTDHLERVFLRKRSGEYILCVIVRVKSELISLGCGPLVEVTNEVEYRLRSVSSVVNIDDVLNVLANDRDLVVLLRESREVNQETCTFCYIGAFLKRDSTPSSTREGHIDTLLSSPTRFLYIDDTDSFALFANLDLLIRAIQPSDVLPVTSERKFRINDSCRVVSEVPIEGVFAVNVSLEDHVRIVVLGDACCPREATMIGVTIRTPFAVDNELKLIVVSTDVLNGEGCIGLVVGKNERNLFCPVVHRAHYSYGRIRSRSYIEVTDEFEYFRLLVCSGDIDDSYITCLCKTETDTMVAELVREFDQTDSRVSQVTEVSMVLPCAFQRESHDIVHTCFEVENRSILEGSDSVRRPSLVGRCTCIYYKCRVTDEVVSHLRSYVEVTSDSEALCGISNRYVTGLSKREADVVVIFIFAAGNTCRNLTGQSIITFDVVLTFPSTVRSNLHHVRTSLKSQHFAVLHGGDGTRIPLFVLTNKSSVTGDIELRRFDRLVTTYAGYIKYAHVRSGITITAEHDRVLICFEREVLNDRFIVRCTTVDTVLSMEENSSTISSIEVYSTVFRTISSSIVDKGIECHLIAGLESTGSRFDHYILIICILVRFGQVNSRYIVFIVVDLS